MSADELTRLLLAAVWVGFALGVVSGAIIGLYFAGEEWMGGYSSWRRRLTRLGHISFFGLGFVNLAAAVSVGLLELSGPLAQWGSFALIATAVTMPICCFLSAWKTPLKMFFPVPVGAAMIGVGVMLVSIL